MWGGQKNKLMNESIEDFGSFNIALEKMLPAILEMQIKTNVYLQFLLKSSGISLLELNQQINLNEALKCQLEQLYLKYGAPPSDITELLNQP